MPKEESSIPLKYIDVTRTTHTHTSLDVLLEKQIEDYQNVDGERELTDACMDRLHKIHLFERKATGRLTRKPKTSCPNDVWSDMWTHMSDAAKKKAKQK